MKSGKKEKKNRRGLAGLDDQSENAEFTQILKLFISCAEDFVIGLKKIERNRCTVKQAGPVIQRSCCAAHDAGATVSSLARQVKPDPRVWKIIDTSPLNLESIS